MSILVYFVLALAASIEHPPSLKRQGYGGASPPSLETPGCGGYGGAGMIDRAGYSMRNFRGTLSR